MMGVIISEELFVGSQKQNLEFGPIMGTKKLCPQMDIPNAFNNAIIEIHSYKLDGLKLFCFDKNGKEVMKCLKVD